VLAIAALAYLCMTMLTPSISILSVTIAAALLGSCLGFLRYNFNPASIFMGDSGSLLLGFNSAVLMILLGEKHRANLFIGAVMVFAFPIMDAALAIIRRWLNGRPLFRGDRSHLYDQLRDRGWSVRQTVKVCYALGLIFAILGTAAMVLSGTALAVLYAAVAVMTAVALHRMGMLRVDDSAERGRSVSVESSPPPDDEPLHP
jgi:UDP-GlcNAc:undecaprenyl-phosphate GlcNAc-1-phosphate transferase